MKREELQHDFHNEQGINWLNSQGEPDIDYVMWLEDKILSRHLSGVIVDITAEEFIREKMRQKYGIENKEMAGLWTYKCNGEEALRWAHEFANIKNAPLPPAEGAERKPKKKLSAHSFWSWCRKDYKTCMVTSTNEIHFDIEDLWRFMDAFAAQQPAAEGAEEILDNLDLGEPLQSGEFYYRSEVVKAMQEFATLHAQKMAEKMVEEKMREELIAYGKVVRSWGIAIPSDILECSIDEYLKSRER